MRESKMEKKYIYISDDYPGKETKSQCILIIFFFFFHLCQIPEIIIISTSVRMSKQRNVTRHILKISSPKQGNHFEHSEHMFYSESQLLQEIEDNLKPCRHSK